MTARTRRSALALLLACWLPGCDAVPTLSFEPGEASLDGGEGGAADAGAEAIAATDAGCGSDAGPGAACCGAPLCFGSYCTARNCALCAATACMPGEVCCSLPNNAMCKAAAACH